MSRYILAVDPGKTGSFAVIDSVRPVDLLHVRAFDAEFSHLADLELWCRYCPEMDLILERVHAMPGQGTASMFTFGEHYGAAKAVLLLSGLPVKNVEPRVWQRRLGLPHRAEIRDVAKRRVVHRKDQKELALSKFPIALSQVKGDVFASVLIAYAAALDELGIPLGEIL